MQNSPALTFPHRSPSYDTRRVEDGKGMLRPTVDYSRAAETFRALGDASRVKIVDALLRQELCTRDLADITGLSEPAVSQHLRLLRMLRIVTNHRHGHRVFYTLDDGHVRSLLALAMAHLDDANEPRTG